MDVSPTSSPHALVSPDRFPRPRTRLTDVSPDPIPHPHRGRERFSLNPPTRSASYTEHGSHRHSRSPSIHVPRKGNLDGNAHMMFLAASDKAGSAVAARTTATTTAEDASRSAGATLSYGRSSGSGPSGGGSLTAPDVVFASTIPGDKDYTQASERQAVRHSSLRPSPDAVELYLEEIARLRRDLQGANTLAEHRLRVIFELQGAVAATTTAAEGHPTQSQNTRRGGSHTEREGRGTSSAPRASSRGSHSRPRESSTSLPQHDTTLAPSSHRHGDRSCAAAVGGGGGGPVKEATRRPPVIRSATCDSRPRRSSGGGLAPPTLFAHPAPATPGGSSIPCSILPAPSTASQGAARQRAPSSSFLMQVAACDGHSRRAPPRRSISSPAVHEGALTVPSSEQRKGPPMASPTSEKERSRSRRRSGHSDCEHQTAHHEPQEQPPCPSNAQSTAHCDPLAERFSLDTPLHIAPSLMPFVDEGEAGTKSPSPNPTPLPPTERLGVPDTPQQQQQQQHQQQPPPPPKLAPAAAAVPAMVKHTSTTQPQHPSLRGRAGSRRASSRAANTSDAMAATRGLMRLPGPRPIDDATMPCATNGEGTTAPPKRNPVLKPRAGMCFTRVPSSAAPFSHTRAADAKEGKESATTSDARNVAPELTHEGRPHNGREGGAAVKAATTTTGSCPRRTQSAAGNPAPSMAAAAATTNCRQRLRRTMSTTANASTLTRTSSAFSSSHASTESRLSRRGAITRTQSSRPSEKKRSLTTAPRPSDGITNSSRAKRNPCRYHNDAAPSPRPSVHRFATLHERYENAQVSLALLRGLILRADAALLGVLSRYQAAATASVTRGSYATSAKVDHALPAALATVRSLIGRVNPTAFAGKVEEGCLWTLSRTDLAVLEEATIPGLVSALREVIVAHDWSRAMRPHLFAAPSAATLSTSSSGADGVPGAEGGGAAVVARGREVRSTALPFSRASSGHRFRRTGSTLAPGALSNAGDEGVTTTATTEGFGVGVSALEMACMEVYANMHVLLTLAQSTSVTKHVR